MKIREARPDEHARVRDLMLRAYGEYGSTLRPEIWAGYAREISDLESRLPHSVLLVADDDGEVTGAVTYYPPDSGGGYGEGWPGGWPGIRLLAVPPEHRGRGLGRLLTQACIDRARIEGAPGIALGTTRLMEIARAMYERMGFVHHPEHDLHPVPEVTVHVYLLRF